MAEHAAGQGPALRAGGGVAARCCPPPGGADPRGALRRTLIPYLFILPFIAFFADLHHLSRRLCAGAQFLSLSRLRHDALHRPG